jgi:hypothetical protein
MIYGMSHVRHSRTSHRLGGYQVSLGLPIDPDEAHRSDHVVIVDMHLPAWGKTKLACNRATRPLGVDKDIGENRVRSP